MIGALRECVVYKPLCSLKYDTTKPAQLFAILSVRLSLDLCLQNDARVQLEIQAIHSHLQWILFVDPDDGYFTTTSQPAPILAEIAATIDVTRGGALKNDRNYDQRQPLVSDNGRNDRAAIETGIDRRGSHRRACFQDALPHGQRFRAERGSDHPDTHL